MVKVSPQGYYATKVEVANEFNVSEGAVRGWIKAAEQNKNNLQLITVDGKNFLKKNQHNKVELARMAEKGRKFRSDETEVKVTVSNELYEIMTENEIVTLINSIKQKKEIPYKFSYLGKGAQYWEKFFQKTTKGGDYIQVDALLLEKFYPFLELAYFKNFDAINVIDLGPGEGTPVKKLLQILDKRGLLNKYVGVDISTRMLELLKNNISQLISPDKIDLYKKDCETDAFKDLLYQYKGLSGNEKILNLILSLGHNIGNTWPLSDQNYYLKSLKEGMFQEDLIIITNILDKLNQRTFFPAREYNEMYQKHFYIPSLLGVKQDFFTKEHQYNEIKDQREINIVFNRHIEVNFNKIGVKIFFPKNSKLTVWKHRRDDIDLIQKKAKHADLQVEHISKYDTGGLVSIMYILKVKDRD